MKSNILGLLAVALLAGPMTSNAVVTINVFESAGSVVFSTSGNLNLSGAGYRDTGGYAVGFIPGGVNWYIASGSGTSVDSYVLTAYDGPFGSSLDFFNPPTGVSGDDFYIWGGRDIVGDTIIPQVGVPEGYVSGTPISSLMFFTGSLAGFSLLPGTYTYSLPNDSVILTIFGAVAVPEPGTLALLGLGLAGLGLSRRRKAN